MFVVKKINKIFKLKQRFSFDQFHSFRQLEVMDWNIVRLFVLGSAI